MILCKRHSRYSPSLVRCLESSLIILDTILIITSKRGFRLFILLLQLGLPLFTLKKHWIYTKIIETTAAKKKLRSRNDGYKCTREGRVGKQTLPRAERRTQWIIVLSLSNAPMHLWPKRMARCFRVYFSQYFLLRTC